MVTLVLLLKLKLHFPSGPAALVRTIFEINVPELGLLTLYPK